MPVVLEQIWNPKLFRSAIKGIDSISLLRRYDEREREEIVSRANQNTLAITTNPRVDLENFSGEALCTAPSVAFLSGVD